ncbi:hypothetical protein [Halomonas sp. BC04]|uniref:hypothetical protein n=1 Tax=Halomonas sp. BC04 TaxID=1403540 RepID=UPI0012DF6A01|nr:hypothetical protein [Halomonas sp. BC04]
MYNVIVDFLPLLIAVSSLLFLSKKLWLYLLKDVIVEKISEIQKTKNQIRELAAASLFECRKKLVGNELEQISLEDVNYIKDVFVKIYDASLHSSNSLATVAYLARYTFSNVGLADVETFDSFDEEGGCYSLGIMKHEYYGKAIRALSLIESKAVRSIEMPKGIAVANSSFLPWGLENFSTERG